MTLAEAQGAPIEVWLCNLQSVNVFRSMGSQWRYGMAGATGLDYSALPVIMHMRGVKPADRAEVFDDVREMEDEALETMRSRE